MFIAHSSLIYWSSSNISNIFLSLLYNCFQIVETEAFRSELSAVRSELEPWEKHLIEHKGKLEVASTESKLLSEKVFADYNI